MAIGTSWVPGSWTETSWEDGSWADSDELVTEPTTWGHAAPGSPDVAGSWAAWEVSPGVAAAVVGDPDYGRLRVDAAEPVYGPIADSGDASEKTFTVALDTYGVGSGNRLVYIRGSASIFTKFAVSPAWTLYTAPVTESWQYVQVKVEEGV